MTNCSKPILVVSLIFSLLLHLLTLAGQTLFLGAQKTAKATILEAHLLPSELPASLPEVFPAEDTLPKAVVERVANLPAHDSVIPTSFPSGQAIEPPTKLTPADEPSLASPVPPLASTGGAMSSSEIAPAAPDATSPLPPSGRILYSQRRGQNGPVIGRTEHEWQHDGQRYRLRATSEASGLAALFTNARDSKTSEGFFIKGELRPEQYAREWTGNASENLRFDWSKQQVAMNNGQLADIALGAQDTLTMHYQLMRLLQRGYKQVILVGSTQVERADLSLLSDDTLHLGAGTFATWHIRIGSPVSGVGLTDVWLAKELRGLPVLIRQSDLKGNVTEFAAEEIAYEGK